MGLSAKEKGRLARKVRIRKRIQGDPTRPRFSVFRSSRYIYAQVIDDSKGETLVTASSAEKDLRSKLKSGSNKDAAVQVGKILAQRAGQKKITQVVFDRNGFGYHGRIRALADSAREAGLKF